MSQKGFSSIIVIVAIVLLAVALGVAYFLNQRHLTTNKLSSQSYKQKETKVQQVQETLNLGNNAVLLKRNELLILPSGSKLDLGAFYFDKESSDYKNNSIRLVKFLKVYHKGYIYNISKSECSSESVFHDDYSIMELKECSLEINISQDKPEFIPYNQFTKKFSSLERRNNNFDPAILPPSPIVNELNEPFLVIIPPYTQLYRDSALQKYTYTTPIGDIVWIYTNYGIKDFKFNLPDDLFNKASRTEQIGPLTVTLRVEGLSCYAPYMRTTGECNKPGEYPVYNKVDFVVDIKQDDKISAEIKILDYKW